jgi:hypothetical protein
MTRLTRITVAAALAGIVAIATGLAQQSATNPDGSLRPAAPLARLFTQDAYTEYALLEPASESFRIRFLPEETRVGATEIVNETRGGSEGGDIKVYDPRTGDPVEFTYTQVGDDADRHAIRAKLPRPVPEGGIGRVLIYKTYKDPRTYQIDGDDLVWVRSLSGYRLGVVLPKGYAFKSSNVAAQLATTTDGRLKLAFANPSGQANPVTIHARKTNAAFTPMPFMDVFFDDVKTFYDLDQPDTGRVNVEQTYSDYRAGPVAVLDTQSYLRLTNLKVTDLDTGKPLIPVNNGGTTSVKLDVPITNERQSAHLRLTGAMGKVDYTIVKGELMFTMVLYGLRNTVLLPSGWDVSAVSQSGTIGMYRNRVFVALINLNSENTYRVTIRARRTDGK